MRLNRTLFILLAFYVVFLGGSSYYFLAFPIRIMHHGLMTLALALWLFGRLRRGRGLPQTPLDVGILALVGVWIVSAVFSLDPRMAFEHLWFLLTHVLLFYVLVDLLQRGSQRLVMETQFLLAALLILLSGLQIASWYFGLGVTPDTQIGWIEVIGPGTWLPLESVRLWLGMGVSTWLAAYAAPLVILTAAWGYTVKRRDYRAVLWVMSALLLVITLLTLSRGGIVALLAGLSILIVLRVLGSSRARAWLSARRWLVGGLLLAGAAAALIIVLVISRNPSRIAGDALRLDLWRGAVSMIGDEPLLGMGPGMFGRAFRNYRDAAIADDRLGTAHNIYLNTTAEIGLAGLLACGLLAFLAVRAWWRLWRQTAWPGARLRLEAALAALVGFAAQSFFDNFMLTAVVTIFLLLVAYSITPLGRSRLDPVATLPRWTGVVALLVVLGYGVWLLTLDRAQASFQASLVPGEQALAQAEAAVVGDPSLNLYPLQVAYLTDVYESALRLEPTWSAGWLNQAAALEQRGDRDGALAALAQAHAINENTPASLHWARLCEMTGCADSDVIVSMYLSAMFGNTANRFPPLAAYWSETPLRRAALEQYMADSSLDVRYRLTAAHFPDMLSDLVPTDPQSAFEWWVVGESSLPDDAQQAVAAFSRAIELSPRRGDYYASRARARLAAAETTENARQEAARDLNLAELLGTYWEFPGVIRVELAQTPTERRELMADALPPRTISQDMEAVLFSRTAVFDIPPAIRFPGPGRAAMQPWYSLAELYIADGNIEQARTVYEAILDYAPDETLAAQALQSLAP